jgi:hypothetical protein
MIEASGKIQVQKQKEGLGDSRTSLYGNLPAVLTGSAAYLVAPPHKHPAPT